jgi:hypothetical protein
MGAVGKGLYYMVLGQRISTPEHPMKTFALAAIATFATSLSAHAVTCPPVVRAPTTMTCNARMSYFGQPMTKSFAIPLADNKDGTFVGKSEFQYNGVSNGDNSPNTISVNTSIETHGNSPTCQQWNDYAIDLEVLGYSFKNLSKNTTITTQDSLGSTDFSLNMACSVK